MGVGLKIYDETGKLKFDAEDRVTRLVYKTYISSSANGNSGALPQIAGQDTIQFAIPHGPPPEHRVTRTGNTIHWARRSGYYSGYYATIYVFAF